MIDTIMPGVAAIDIGDKDLFVAVGGGEVRRFGSFTRDLKLLCEHLKTHHVRRVAMEATGVYWVAPHDMLQESGFEVTLFDGAGARNLPGRKSDVLDCQWHAMLHSHGLLRACFIAPEPIRKLRAYCRLRDDHLEMGAAHIQHMQRALDLMNVRLHNVLSQLHGVSGMRVVEAIVAGMRDPVQLAQLCDPRVLKTKEKELIASLEGQWQEHHLFALEQALKAYRFYQEQIAQCDRQIQATLKAINREAKAQPRVEGRKVKVTRHNAPLIDDLYGELLTLCQGRDAQLLPAVGPLTWLKLAAEVGNDLTRWKSEKHFTAWLGLSPASAQSGKRRRRIARRKTRAGQILREAVMSLQKSKDCALGEFYRRVKARRGAPVAIVATARKLAELYWRVMVHGIEYAEKGLTEYARLRREQVERYLRKQAAKLGLALQPLT